MGTAPNFPDGAAQGSGEARRAQEWYRDGLQFGCTQCGNCCTGGPGAVWFSPEEGRAMARDLNLTEEVFLKRYTRRISGGRSLREHETSHGFDCVFLDRTKIPGKAVCGIYRTRPLQCRTWPFWPENLVSRKAWEEARQVTPCPGMGRGPSVSLMQIRVQRDAQAAKDSAETG